MLIYYDISLLPFVFIVALHARVDCLYMPLARQAATMFDCFSPPLFHDFRFSRQYRFA